MFFNRLMFIFLFGLTSFWSLLASQETELLKRDNINKIMKEMFEQHVDKKEMSASILKNSFKIYLEQFDPDRIYLLRSEVDEALQVNDPKMYALLKDYEKGNLTSYENLDQIIQKSIIRAREIRKELMENNDLLFQSSSSVAELEDIQEDKKPPFPTNVEELKERVKNQMIRFIGFERKKYGDRKILENQEKTLNAYEHFSRHFENQYLYVDDAGNPLPKKEQENLFVLHVLKALARSLDSHTTFLDPNEAYEMKIRLEKGFQGFGVILEKKSQGVVISKLIADSPASKSGKIKVDDKIVEINGQNVEDKTLDELVDRLRKEETIHLHLKRDFDAAPISVTLKKEQIQVDDERVTSTTTDFENGIIATFTLNSFYQGGKGVTSEKDLRKAIQDLSKKEKIKGIILDLRENSGGFLTQAVKVAGLFITNGVIVVSKYFNGEERFYRDMDGKVSFDGPLIILTSKATASAAEIVAQALQDYGVAIVVGDEHTYGKGTIQSQTVTDKASTSYFKVTIGKYYTVSGKTPQKIGVKADILLPSHYSHELIGEEYLDGALSTDNIPAVFKDKLLDVEPNLKSWYLHYYMPTLQKKENTWEKFLPLLKKNSLTRQAKYHATPLSSNIPSDPQLAEALNILKDMIHLDQTQHQRTTASIEGK
jgi:carboxyl-terminal processing protease